MPVAATAVVIFLGIMTAAIIDRETAIIIMFLFGVVVSAGIEAEK